MTVQEIQEVVFEKAVFGGYDMKSVDTFLEKMVDEVSTSQKELAALQNENAALKSKMKVLVNKVEEYRSLEDGMHRALMNAESVAKDTIEKAKQEAKRIINAANAETENAKGQTSLEADKLEAARKQTLDFVARMSAEYQAQAKSLLELAKSEKLFGINDKQEQPAYVQPVSQAPVPVREPEPSLIDEDLLMKEPSELEEPFEDATKRFDFSDLKFGSDYDPKKSK